MSAARGLRGRLLAALACLVQGIAPASAAGAAPEADYAYHARPHDTLIGIGRRLLLEPLRWHDLQTRNAIADPRRIPAGTVLRIPYAWLRISPESATVEAVAGAVKRADGTLAAGDQLAQGSVVETGADGSATLKLADGSVVTLQKSSVLTLQEMSRVTGEDASHSIRLKLDSGRVEAVVKPHRDVGRFEIITPVAVTAVRGTRFRDGVAGGGARATTETIDGTVGVAGGAASVPVPAGFGTRVEGDAPPLPPVPLLPPPDLGAAERTNASADLPLSWRPVPEAVAYRVQLAADADFHALAADIETAQPQASVAPGVDGTYWVRARSIDRFGIEGTDAVVRITQHVLPAAPAPAAPADAAKLSGPTVSFDWTPVPQAAHYALQVAPAADFAQPAVVRADPAAAHADLAAPAPGSYAWRVAAVNARGEMGPWSAVRRFALRPAAPLPEVPQIQGREMRLRWEPLPAPRYRVQVAIEASFTHPLVDRITDSAAAILRKPLPGTYYVRVQGVDDDGSVGAFGPVRRFQVPVPRWLEIVLPAVVVIALLQ